MRRILIGFDGSERGDDALVLGRTLAAAADGAEVLVATAYEQLTPKSSLDDERPAQARRRVEAERLLERARERWPELDPAAFQTVCANSPPAALHRLADEREADVIVVGASHRGGLGRIWPGSVTDRTLHGAPCAVAVASPGYAASPRGSALERIGVAFDGSVEARHALREAAALARRAGATLVLIYVVDVALTVPVSFDYAGYVRELNEVAGMQLAEAAASVPAGVTVEQRQLEGQPVEELVDLSRDLDLLVMGSRGYGPVRRLLLGAVSAPVVRRAACPLLVLARSAAPRPDRSRSAGVTSAASTIWSD